MIAIEIEAKEIEKLRQALGRMERRLPRELATAINATARKVKTETAKELKKYLAVSPTSILKTVVKFKAKATANQTEAVIRFQKGFPIPLRYFRPRQMKRGGGGVTYKIDPAFNRRSIIRDAFMPPRYNGRVYRRIGIQRGPLEQLYGPAPEEAYQKGNIDRVMIRVARQQLPYQIERRIRLLILREQGIVKPRGK